MSESVFVFGVKGLDHAYGKALRPGMLIAIAGHPGAGKTTLALMMCLANIKRGHRCLFVSTQEDEFKIRDNCRNLGLDVAEAIESDHLKFVKLPMPSSDEAVDSAVETIANLVLKYRPQIVVVDSISSFMKILVDVKRRALLQNFFSGLAKDIEGLVIVTVEVPLSTMYIENTGDIEFVADAIIALKYSIIRGTPSRRLEIQKLRGHSIEVAGAPFTFVKGSGIEVVYPYEYFEDSSRQREEKVFMLSMKTLDKIIGGIRSGEIATIATSSLQLSMRCAINLARKIAAVNSARVLFFSTVPMEVTRVNVDGGELIVVSSDPTRESLSDLAVKFHKSLEEFKPDVAVTFGIDLVNTLISKEEREEFYRYVVMNANKARNTHIALVELVAATSPSEPLLALLSQLSDIFVVLEDGHVGLPERKSIARIRGVVQTLQQPEGQEALAELCLEK
ncbi:MAG: ATPase domain-containing protein [Acidilobaceae archaeon]